MSAVAVVLMWTLARGVSVIPRSDSPAFMAENLQAVNSVLTAEDMATLDAMNEAHFYCEWQG